MIALRRPAWWSVLLTVVGALLFVRLGLWQLHRADEKDALLRRYATSVSAPLRDFAEIAAMPPETSYPHVQIQGRYLANRVYLLDNPRHDALGGVEVYAPFHVAEGDRLLLVDLGFLPGNGTAAAPQVPALPTGAVTLQGLYVPPPGVALEMGGDALARQQTWPKKTIYLDPEQVAADLGRMLYPRVLALDPDPAAIFVRKRTLDFSAMPPSRHRAYAFQWFTFAVAAVVIFLVLHRKRRQRARPKTSDTP
ncbi:SURF1 family protein [Dyella sp.]|jgi:cytochrome oxidase assembly protein ShyY1|uniref:SURF1 family protein n=1 Tax=Dyella sp. TaxID=1869338 RepID=UPI002D788D8A|nr:SURF1 family protein [Dyella sp.]HET6431961.1 SURF1 family protein [Dyella sp.]